MQLVVPGVGEVVALDNPREVALALDSVRDLERQLRSVKQELTSAIVYASQQAGSKTLHLEGMKVVVKGGEQTVYDAEAIEEGLREQGMSEERIREIVKETVTYTIVAAQASQAAGANPAYAEVIEMNKTVIDAPASISITRKSA